MRVATTVPFLLAVLRVRAWVYSCGVDRTLNTPTIIKRRQTATLLRLHNNAPALRHAVGDATACHHLGPRCTYSGLSNGML